MLREIFFVDAVSGKRIRKGILLSVTRGLDGFKLPPVVRTALIAVRFVSQ